MSQNGSVRGKAAAAAAQRDRSLMQLLDPSNLMPGHTIADLYSLRHLSLQGGIPDSPSWLRAQAWKVLLGYLPPEKKEWPTVLDKRRQEYYRFVSDFSPSSAGVPQPASPHLSERDALLDQIYKDLSRSRKNGFAFYQGEVRPSRSCPLAPEPADHPASSTRGATAPRLDARQALLERLAQINASFAEQLGRPHQHQAAEQEQKAKARTELLAGQPPSSHGSEPGASNGPRAAPRTEKGALPAGPPIYLSPPSPGGASANSSQASFASAVDTETGNAGTADGPERSDVAGFTADAASGPSEPSDGVTPPIVDRNWHSLLRILYFYALLNPSIGYVQGMNEALFTLFYAFGTAGSLPRKGVRGAAAPTGRTASVSRAAGTGNDGEPAADDGGEGDDSLDDEDEDGTSPHAEADAFWCFSLLIGEVKELYDFEGVDRAMSGDMLAEAPATLSSGVGGGGNFLRIGMAGALKRFRLRQSSGSNRKGSTTSRPAHLPLASIARRRFGQLIPGIFRIGTDAASGPSEPSDGVTPPIVDRNWHSLLRILYFYALLNPSIGYVQGMNEALFTLFYAFGTAGSLPRKGVRGAAAPTGRTASVSRAAGTGNDGEPAADDGGEGDDSLDDEDEDGTSPHAEADAFWCFSLLIGEVKELYDFEGVDRAMSGDMLAEAPATLSSGVGGGGNFLRIGMAGALKRFSLRLRWLEPELWRSLRAANLDPRMPYYSFRWLACLVSTELSLPSVLRVWDALLAEQETSQEGAFPAKIEFLIDMCCALLIQIKPLLTPILASASATLGDPKAEDRDAFSEGMRVLQAYPEEDVGPVIELAILFRQRRLAADLTGDGPPDDDDVADGAEAGLASVRARAAQTLQRWGKSASPQTSTMMGPRSLSASGASGGGGGGLTPAKSAGWFGSMTRNFSAGAGPLQGTPDGGSPDTSRGSSGWASAASTPSRPSVGGVFQRYAEAIQSSDAAANFSKASTNLTAKALASFGGGSRETSPEPEQPPFTPAKMPSLGAVGASFFKKARSGSDASSAIMGRGGSPQTPDMARWSRDTMPDFPLPDVSNSPAGRTEYTDSMGKRMSLAYSHANGRHRGIGSPTLSDPNSEGGFGSLPLPSLRAAAKLGILPRQRTESPAGSVRGAGPKPLLLRQSARPPREGSSSGTHNLDDEPSRKVSTGPLAHAANGSRSTSRTGRDSSMAGSLSGRSSTTPSETGSGHSGGIDSPNTSLASHAVGQLSSLSSLNGTSAAAIVPIIPPELAAVSPLSSMSGPVGLMGSADGTVSAGAFAKVRAAAAGDASATTTTGGGSAAAAAEHRPKFGEVSSSSDVPLVSGGGASGIGSGSTITRPRPAAAASHRKRGSSSTIGSTSNSVSGSIKSSRATSAAFSTSSAAAEILAEPESWVSGEGVELSDKPVPVPSTSEDAPSDKRTSIFEKPRAAPRPPPEQPGPVLLESQAEEPDAFDAPVASPTRYELHDEPIGVPTSPPDDSAVAPVAKARMRSSSGIVRSKRFTKNRTSTSSSVTAQTTGSIARDSTVTAAGRRSSSSRISGQASKPTLVLPTSHGMLDGGLAEDRGIGATAEDRPPPSPGPGAGTKISTSQLLDQLVSEAPATGQEMPASLRRPASYASNGSYGGRSSTEGHDLLSDDMFAAPTASFGTAPDVAYHERPHMDFRRHDGSGDVGGDGEELDDVEREREGRRISVPLSSTGSFFGNIDGGLEAIGSSLAFPESDVEDNLDEDLIPARRDAVGVL
ncbi:uncharacterized protein PSFLO_00952 [Pseudozyma flocculosa]|uniref:Rab-GAP TBC domain-containing protein n=1 Tax=Pseudozyma flocculosa TaxID=84751 RepID=A0A5C3EWK2_9BASI|nr:uncharacterized protein PSFLO_00952 [Pseudozyma flocculosa]